MRLKLLAATLVLSPILYAQAPRRNVILFVADGLRRGSVTPEDMPTFYALRSHGVDFINSHAVYPTFTTANASVIATGHGLGDTGDYSNALYPGVWLTPPFVNLTLNEQPAGYVIPFLENDAVLADMNAIFHGNYLGEKTLLSTARAAGFHVASIGKIGPTAIQQIDVVHYDQDDALTSENAIILDDATGTNVGLPIPVALRQSMVEAGLPLEAPQRTNGFLATSIWSNGNSGDATHPGTQQANLTQQSWFADVTTKVILPQFTADAKPFALLFWSRDPDGTQHNQGDSLQQLSPGINGETSRRALRNADRALKQLLDWLDAHPAVKANTDILVTSDHGFATISRREVAADGTQTAEVSSALAYSKTTKAPEPQGTLPTGFVAVDLAVRGHMRLFDAEIRALAGGAAFKELNVTESPAEAPAGSAFLSDKDVQRLDGSDARLIVAANGGSDLIYVPSGNPEIVHQTLAMLTRLDYVGGLFVDDKYCPTPAACPGALRLSDINLVGSSKVPRPAIVIALKTFYLHPGDLQSAIQIADTSLQEGQGNHGGFGRAQTFNNMAAIGPDFKSGFVDPDPMGNMDIVPTMAKILGLTLPSVGTLKGRVLTEALAGPAQAGGKADKAETLKPLVSAPSEEGFRTVLERQRAAGVSYLDSACYVAKAQAETCR